MDDYSKAMVWANALRSPKQAQKQEPILAPVPERASLEKQDKAEPAPAKEVADPPPTVDLSNVVRLWAGPATATQEPQQL